MQNPEEFSRNLNHIVTVIGELYKKHGGLLKWNSESESILDLGIGDGRVTKEIVIPFIPKNVKEYIGADLSEPMLNSATQSVPHQHFKSLQLDAGTKNLPNELKNRFDHILANGLLHHVQDTRQALTNMKDMLKPGGQLLFIAFEKLFADEAYDKMDQGKWAIYDNHKAISPFYKCENPIKEYETIIRDLGFVDCNIFIEPFKDRLPERAFEEMFAAVNTRLPLVKENDKKEYLQDFIKEAKKSSLVKLVIDEKSNEKYYEIFTNIITGVVSKPQ